MEALLETGYMDIEVEDFRRERMLGGKLFSPPDALLPRSLGHRAIMGLRLAASNWVSLRTLRIFSAASAI